MHRDLSPGAPRLRIPGGELGRAFDDVAGDRARGGAVFRVQSAFGKGGPDHHVAPGKPVGVEPEVPGARHLERQVVVVAGALSDQDLEAVELVDTVAGGGAGYYRSSSPPGVIPMAARPARTIWASSNPRTPLAVMAPTTSPPRVIR